MLLVLIVVSTSCGKKAINLSKTPKIEFESIDLIKDANGKDSIIELAIYFEDGDGDIGLTDTDTAAPFNYGSPYFHNMPIKYLVKDGSGNYTELINPIDMEPYGNKHQRVPVLTPTSKHKLITGTLRVFLNANPLNTKPADAKFEIRLMDRNLNISNTVTTPSVQLSH
mgnify:CR=1 FL=1